MTGQRREEVAEINGDMISMKQSFLICHCRFMAVEVEPDLLRLHTCDNHDQNIRDHGAEDKWVGR